MFSVTILLNAFRVNTTGTNSAENAYNLGHVFLIFPLIIGFDISQEITCMKFQTLFSRNTNNILKCCQSDFFSQHA